MYTIEKLYESGKIPDRYYNQINGKTAAENYRTYKIKKHQTFRNIILSLV